MLFRSSSYTTFFPGTGCWERIYSSSDLRAAAVRWDTTTWAPGAHTLQWTVTDSSGRTATSSTLTFTTSNPSPSVSWVSSNNPVVSGVATFEASAAPAASGTAAIVKWCLSVDGSPVSSDVSTYVYSSYSNISSYTTFFPGTGCWERIYSSSDLRAAAVRWDTTTWAPGADRKSTRLNSSHSSVSRMPSSA